MNIKQKTPSETRIFIVLAHIYHGQSEVHSIHNDYESAVQAIKDAIANKGKSGEMFANSYTFDEHIINLK